MRIIDRKQGKYIIDELNSIILESYYANNTFYCCFKVENSLIIMSERMFDDKLEFNLLFINTSESDTTGGIEDIPEVISHKLSSQHAVLKKE